MNPYSPENVLDSKHLQRHNRVPSKHSRSQTTMPFGNRNNLNSSIPQTRQRGNSRRHHSVK